MKTVHLHEYNEIIRETALDILETCNRTGQVIRELHLFCCHVDPFFLSKGIIDLTCGTWKKHIHRLQDLFDLEKDPRETTDLFNDEYLQPVIDRLTAEMDEFYNTYADAVKNGLNVKNLPRHNTSESWRDPRNLH